MKEASVNKRNSSGCLIIKKKAVTVSNDSSYLFKSSSNNININYKKKKRKKRIRSDSESSDNSSENHTVVNGYKGENEKKVSNGLDVFEFDEYDSVNNYSKWNLLNTQNAHQIKIGSGNKNNTISKPAYTSRFEIKDDDVDDNDDDADLPLSVLRKKYRLSSDNKPTIRLQGKNGVLKVTVNKDQDTSKQKTDNKSKSKEKSSNKREKITKNEGFFKKPKPIEKVTRIKANKESNFKHGSGTEKQILREKIKDMLLAADWTIDYRKRRNKDYLDAVYISPSGTAYWSIIKAYDALQNEEMEDFAPLPDEILGKLTRQTRNKIERQMKNKRKNEVSDTDDDNKDRRKIDRCTLLVRGSENAENGFEPYYGKRTILSWLIDSDVVNINEHVEYMNPRKTRILQKGWITKDGIRCGCCSKIVTVFEFEVHAGSKVGEPFRNMFLESGKSLMQCQIDAWNKQGELEKKGYYSVDNDDDDDDDDDPNDDTCGLCGDGGDLICCDGCPSTFHQSCLDIQMLPEGDWHCPNCSCKYCGITSIEVSSKIEASLVMCGFCQKKYHESCKPEIDVKPIECGYLNLSFCGHHCHELYSRLQKFVGVKHELDSGFSWSFIHRSDSDSDLLKDESSEQRVECNSKLAVAMSVMDECFLPFTDRRSGTNLIRNVVFNCGSNLSRLNYSGFCTAILERGDEMVCAASIRIHGNQVAEMPFIGTRHIYRRHGMCRRLLSAIETALSSLQVEKLIIPAVTEHVNTWTDVFGFQPLEESHKQELKSMNMLVFPGTDMLQKPLMKQDTLNAVPQGNSSVEADAFSEKSELISSEVKTDSGSCVDASKNTLPINSPVKNDDVIPCEAKLSGVSDDAHFVEESNEITDKPIQAPGIEMESDYINSPSKTNEKEEISVQNGCEHQQLQSSGMESVSMEIETHKSSDDDVILETGKHASNAKKESEMDTQENEKLE